MIETIFWLGVNNALMATLLALLALGAGLFLRRPALVHSLWLLVLIKLITPPLAPVPVPRLIGATVEPAALAPESAPNASNVPLVNVPTAPIEKFELAAPAPGVFPDAQDPTVTFWPSETQVMYVAFAVWVAGALAWWTLVLFRRRRFRLLLAKAQPAPLSLRENAHQLARRLGLAKAPEIHFTAAPISPLLAAVVWRPKIIIPVVLWTRLSEAQRQTLLLHELAHLRRRDHWVRRFELVVRGLYWWHPVVWLAGGALRHAEEECCDAWVVWARPEAAGVYAETIVETLAFISEARAMLPVGASGIENTKDVKRRLTMIMRGNMRRSVPVWGFVALLLLSIGLLPLWPSWARTQTPPDGTGVRATPRTQNNPKKSNQGNNTLRTPADDVWFSRPLLKRRIPQPQTRSQSPDIESAIRKAENALALLKVQLLARRAELDEAKSNVVYHATRLQRLTKLSERGVVSREELETAKHQARMYEARLRLHEANLQEVRLRISQEESDLKVLQAHASTTKKSSPPNTGIDSSNPDTSAASPAQVDAARSAYNAALKAYQGGNNSDVEKCYLWSRRWLEAQRGGGKRIAAYAAHADRMDDLQQLAVARHRAGRSTGVELAAVNYYVVQARDWLARVKKGNERPSGGN